LERRRIPQKLQIKIQPSVVNRELPEFKLKWEQTLTSCEKRLMNLLIEHLDTVIDKTKPDIRRDSNNCLEALKKKPCLNTKPTLLTVATPLQAPLSLSS